MRLPGRLSVRDDRHSAPAPGGGHGPLCAVHGRRDVLRGCLLSGAHATRRAVVLARGRDRRGRRRALPTGASPRLVGNHRRRRRGRRDGLYLRVSCDGRGPGRACRHDPRLSLEPALRAVSVGMGRPSGDRDRCRCELRRRVAVLRDPRRARLPGDGAALRGDDVGVGRVLSRSLSLRGFHPRGAPDRGGRHRGRARQNRRDAQSPSRAIGRARSGEHAHAGCPRLRLEQSLPLRPAPLRLLAGIERRLAARRAGRARRSRVSPDEPGALAGAASRRADRDRRRRGSGLGAGRVDAPTRGRVRLVRAGRARRANHRRAGGRVRRPTRGLFEAAATSRARHRARRRDDAREPTADRRPAVRESPEVRVRRDDVARAPDADQRDHGLYGDARRPHRHGATSPRSKTRSIASAPSRSSS